MGVGRTFNSEGSGRSEGTVYAGTRRLASVFLRIGLRVLVFQALEIHVNEDCSEFTD